MPAKKGWGPWAAAAGVLLGLATVAVISIRNSSNLPPRLAREDFDAATARWKSAGLKSYDMDVELSGRQRGRIHVEVRNGRPTSMSIDDHVPRRRSTWETWTVDSMFDFVDAELQGREHPAEFFNVSGDATIVQRAAFDAKYGVPSAYQRQILGTPLEISWKVTDFTPLEDQ